MIYNDKRLYYVHKAEIMKDCNDDEFMGLFERMPEFDEYDDEFVENEERWTAQVAEYIDNNIERFATVKEE